MKPQTAVRTFVLVLILLALLLGLILQPRPAGAQALCKEPPCAAYEYQTNESNAQQRATEIMQKAARGVATLVTQESLGHNYGAPHWRQEQEAIRHNDCVGWSTCAGRATLRAHWNRYSDK